ncbi:MAG: hypothetical protein HYZ63_00180 [Candidatus Andersenbacteria bacterium]|nr:hypothetical protein [Candidatus Andersenbacteria bacterium]
MNKRGWRLHVWVLLWYIGLTLLMTWPTILHLSDSVIGAGGDGWQAVWRFGDSYNRAVASLKSDTGWKFFTAEFLGGGEARLTNLSVWPWMPLKMLFGLPTAYNLVYLLSFVLSGYAMYLLASYWGPTETGKSVWVQEAPAFLTGLFYMFLPYHAAHGLGHFGAMQMQWIPFIILVCLSLYRRFSWGKFVLLWILLTIQVWTEHHYALWLALLAVITVMFFRKDLLKKVSWRKWQLWALMGAFLILLFVSVGLSYYPTLRLSTQSDTLELGQGQTIRFSADLFSLVVPASFHSVWGGVFHSLFGTYFTGNIAESTQFLGFVPLLLVIFFRQHIPRAHKKYWLTVMVIFLLIALGPRLHVFGHVFSWPMPYALVDSWPVFSAVRTVARAGVMVSVAMSLLFYWVLKQNVNRRGSAIVLGVVLLLEFSFLPVPIQSAELSPIYNSVRPGVRTRIIEIPAATNYTAASRALFASQVHGKEVLGNNALERAQAAEEFDLPRAVPAVRQLLYLRTVDLRRDRSEFFAQSLPESLPDALTFFDVGEIILHTDSLSALEISAIRGFLEEDAHLTPIHISDALLYQIPDTFTVPHDGVFLMRDKRWQAVGLDPKRGHVFGEIESGAAITLVNVTSTPVAMRIKLSLAPESPGGLRLKLGDKVIGEIKPGGVGVYPIGALPGNTVVEFERLGPGKAIVQNPQLLTGQ